MNCEFCNKYLTDQYTLIRHQHTTKKCIKIQKEQNNPNLCVKTFNCELCSKEFSSKQSLNYHSTKTCKFKNSKEVNEIDTANLKIRQLEYELKKTKDELNSKNVINVTNNVMNVTNNITINMNFLDFMNAENVKEIFDKYYNSQTFLGSEKSLAVFMVEKFLLGKDKPPYFCPDKSRYNFTYFNNDEVMDDLNAKILITLSKIHGADAIYNAYIDNKKNIENVENIDQIYNKLKNLDHNNKEYLNELRILLPKNLKDRAVQNKIFEIKSNDDEKNRIIYQKEVKKLKIQNCIIENVDVSDYENTKGVTKILLQEFIKYYFQTNKMKCPQIFSDKDKHKFKNYILNRT